jgi:antirestriction protein ArdC
MDFIIPKNAVTGNIYTEGNVLRLLDTPFEDQQWATFRQWKDAGYMVQKGSKGTELIKIVTVKDKKNPENKKSVPRRFYVFNIAQVKKQ